MKKNNRLRFHFLNVGHGDSTIIEFPDSKKLKQAVFGVVDFGAHKAEDYRVTTDYLQALVDLRDIKKEELSIAFTCVTHPHDDHFKGLTPFLDHFADPEIGKYDCIEQFWDCGFWTTYADYIEILQKVNKNKKIRFIRVSSGTEFNFSNVRLQILAPSIDLRNRFDTYGIDRNNASIVIKISNKKAWIILAGDAEWASWSKSTEEFPRSKRIKFIEDALGLAKRKESSDQLKCDLLRVSHHGSCRGSSYEYLERMKPNRCVISAADKDWYEKNTPSNWHGKFPHPLVSQTLQCLKMKHKPWITGIDGNVLITYSGKHAPISERVVQCKPRDPNFQAELKIATGYLD